MKKLSNLVLTLFILTSSILSSHAQAAGVQVKVNGQMQAYDQAPIIVNDLTLVPMRGVFESLGATVTWDSINQKVTAKKYTTEISLVIGSKTGFVNSKPVPLDVAARIVEGRTMVPLRLVSETLGAEVGWDSKTKTVTITTEKLPEAQVGNQKSNSSSKHSISTNAMTLEQAFELAVNSSNELKTTKIDIEKADKSLEKAAEAIDYIPAGGGNQQATSAFTNWNRAQTSYFMAQRQYEIKKETLEYNVRVAYNDILQKQEAKKVAQLTLEDKEFKKRVTDAKAKNGMASQFEVTQAASGIQEAKASLEASSKALEDAYTKLNNLLGKNANERYELVNKPVFEKSKNVDLETIVSQVVTGSSAVWLAEQQVNLANLDVKYFTFSGTTNDKNAYEQKQLDQDKAQFSAADTKQQIESAVRSIYYSINQLEQQYEVVRANLAKAEEGLKLVQVRYNQGMATASEVLEVKLGVEQLHQQLFNITAQLDTLKIAFTKPWVASGR